VNDQFRRRAVGAPATRSVLLTVLGEYVLPRPGGVWQETLVGALGTMGFKVHAARQALARSVSGGWLRTERRGRRSRLHLTPGTAEMLQSGAERIYGFGQPWEWDGRWLLVSLSTPEAQREVRHLVRTQLAWAGFGSLGNGLWITPHVEREAELGTVVEAAPAAQVVSFRAELGAIGQAERVVSEAWDLDAVGAAYRHFSARFSRLRPSDPGAVFRAQTELVHAWRKFPYLDPDLPEQMLPARWPRSSARSVFEDRHAAWHETAQVYFGEVEDGLVHGRASEARVEDSVRSNGGPGNRPSSVSKSARTASK
jgi:phenylacetic acid degradation operon negative regulatory protein